MFSDGRRRKFPKVVHSDRLVSILPWVPAELTPTRRRSKGDPRIPTSQRCTQTERRQGAGQACHVAGSVHTRTQETEQK